MRSLVPLAPAATIADAAADATAGRPGASFLVPEALLLAAAVAVRVWVAPHWNGAEVTRTCPDLAKYLATKESLALALPVHIIDFSPEVCPEAYPYVK